VPEKIELEKDEKMIEHSFTGHHREILHRLVGIKKSYNIDYLKSFVLNNPCLIDHYM
jgi:hypothetical protein